MRLRMARITPALKPSFALVLPLLTLVLACGYLYITDAAARTRGDYLKDFVLPYARSAMPDDSPEAGRLEVCILRDGALRLHGEPATDDEVRQELAVEARLSRAPASKFANRMLSLRADERVPVKHVLKIMRWCSSEEIRLWRLRFWTRPHE